MVYVYGCAFVFSFDSLVRNLARSTMSNSSINGEEEPKRRNTRSASVSSTHFAELKQLIEESSVSVINALRTDLKLMEDKLLDRIMAVENSVLTLRKEHDGLASEVTALKLNFGALECNVKRDIDSCMDEFQNRSIRMNNLILHGVPEQDAGTADERIDLDKTQVERMLSDLNIVNADITDCKRIGKGQRNGPRLLRIRMQDVNKKFEILRKSNGLRNTTSFKKVFVHQDFTRWQRDEQKCLRDELKIRREHGEDVVIYRGKVTKRSDIRNFR